MSAPARIVLVRPGALGDALLTFPALALLRRGRPDTHITLVSHRGVLPLAKSSGLVDAAYPFDLPAWSALFSANLASTAALARAVITGAEVVVWRASADREISAHLGALGAARAIVAAARPFPDQREHMALRLARALEPLGVGVPATVERLVDVLPPLQVPSADIHVAGRVWDALGLGAAEDRGGTVVGLHPGSGGAAKRWPPEAFAALASDIRSWGMRPLLIAGPQDEAVCAAVAAASENLLPVVRDLSVGVLAALLRRCRAFAGNDSGVSHLAGLLGVAALALFGPTDPGLWTPLGPRVRVLRSPGTSIGDLPAAAVAAALRALLASAPG